MLYTHYIMSKKVRWVPDFGIAGHFIFGVMNIHGILNDCAIFIDFNLLCNSSNCKIVTIPVKFNTTEEKCRFGQEDYCLSLWHLQWQQFRVFSISKVILSTGIRDLLEMPSNWSRLYVHIKSLPRHIKLQVVGNRAWLHNSA